MKKLRILATLLLASSAVPARAQQAPTDTKNRPAQSSDATRASLQYKTPTWGIIPAPPPPEPPGPPSPPLPQAPEKVVIPAGTRFATTLDTPLSTRISKVGQLVNFRTSEAFPVYEGLVIPPDTIFSGTVTEMRRPGSFGKSGVLRVKVDHIQLTNGASAEVAAKLDSQDINGRGRLQSDNNRAANLASVAIWAAQGTLLGGQIHGWKGAGVGAGAGAAVALLILMSRHGSDVYLEPGTPFLVLLDQPVSLPGTAVAAVQPPPPSPASDASGADGSSAAAGNSPPAESDRPALKHRPKP